MRRPPTAHEELRALVQRYARAADERDVGSLADLFHPEAVIDGVRGPMGLDAWLEAMAAPASRHVSMHMLGDPLLSVDEEAGTATLDTYAVVFQIGDQAAGQTDLTLGIRYRDEAVRHEGRWVLRHRVARTVWMR